MSIVELFRKELTLEESIQKSRELADLVKQTYTPDFIVAIASGGILPAKEVSKRLERSYGEIVIRRDIDLRETYNSTPNILKPFVKLYQGYLFMSTQPTILQEGDFTCQGRKILLVDDMVHTGKTIQIAKDNLFERGAKEVKSAAINYVNGALPDYFLMKGRIKFPWSKNSADYKRFESYVGESSVYQHQFS